MSTENPSGRDRTSVAAKDVLAHNWSMIRHAQQGIVDAEEDLGIARRRFEFVLNEANRAGIPYSKLAEFTSYTKQHVGSLIRNALRREAPADSASDSAAVNES
jgi:hypothetical protein